VDAISPIEAMNSLIAALRFFLPSSTDPALQPMLVVSAVRIAPTGLGGFVGINADPVGEILGRRLEATVLVTIKASNQGSLDSSVTAAIAALLGTNRVTLLERGIQKISLEALEADSTPAVGNEEPNPTLTRTFTVKVLYEFLKPPEADGSLIQQIPITLGVSN
jgi:hypothetical protein